MKWIQVTQRIGGGGHRDVCPHLLSGRMCLQLLLSSADGLYLSASSGATPPSGGPGGTDGGRRAQASPF